MDAWIEIFISRVRLCAASLNSETVEPSTLDAVIASANATYDRFGQLLAHHSTRRDKVMVGIMANPSLCRSIPTPVVEALHAGKTLADFNMPFFWRP